ncbi:MAG: hypothetical protein ACTSQE_03095 [Candidatus Heimdallarchaeaceae archaeon]
MSMYIVEKTGELTQCSDKEKALNSENVLIVVSHLGKKVYTWVGSSASPQAKFACARETARIRMELGYRAVNLEEADTTESFLQAVEEASSGITSHITSSAPRFVSSVHPTPSRVETRESAPKPAEPISETSVDSQVSPNVRLSTSTPSVIDVNYVVKQISALPPIEGMVRDYIIIGNELYIAPDEDTSEVAIMDSLPDGGFVAEDYLPRLYIESGKVIAIELWRAT